MSGQVVPARGRWEAVVRGRWARYRLPIGETQVRIAAGPIMHLCALRKRTCRVGQTRISYSRIGVDANGAVVRLASWASSPSRSRHAATAFVIRRRPSGDGGMTADAAGWESGGGGRNRTGVDGFAGRCMTTLPPRPGWTRPEQASIALPRPDKRKIKRKGRAASSNFRLSRGIWSGKRVSNSRPQPWQGCALPTELFPHAPRIIPSPPARSRRTAAGITATARQQRRRRRSPRSRC